MPSAISAVTPTHYLAPTIIVCLICHAAKILRMLQTVCCKLCKRLLAKYLRRVLVPTGVSLEISSQQAAAADNCVWCYCSRAVVGLINHHQTYLRHLQQQQQ
jgi:hypothetical protein